MSSIIQRSFAGGEIAPQLYARTDEVKYATGLRTLRNFILLKHGGVSNRPGTSFVGEVADSTQKCRLIPFEASDTVAYVLELGNGIIRVIKNGEYVTIPLPAITSISKANPCVVTATGIGGEVSTGDQVKFSVVSGMVELKNRTFKAVNIDADNISLQNLDGTPLDSTSFGSFTAGNATISALYVLESGAYFNDSDLPLIKFTQSVDVMTLTHPSYPPITVNYLGSDTNWTIEPYTFGTDIVFSSTLAAGQASGSPPGPTSYAITAISSSSGNESLPVISNLVAGTPNATQPITLTWLTTVGALYYNIYVEIGGATGIYGFIGSSNTLTFIDVGGTPDALNIVPLTSYLPFNGVNQYPGCCAYVQQRLCFGNQNKNPEKVFMSQTGKFSNFNKHVPIQASDEIEFNLAGQKLNAVKHIVDLGFMVIFGQNGEFAVNCNGEGAITPSNIVVKQQSFFGCSDVRPIPIGTSALYIQARGNVIRDLGFKFETQSYTGNDLTVFATHLFEGFTIVDWDYQQIPNSIIWAVRSDGIVVALTYIEEQQIWGWHRHDFQNGFVENVCCIPNGTEDSVYFVVRRVINGENKRFVEVLNTRYISDVQDSIFMDSAVTYDGTVTGNSIELSGSSFTYRDNVTVTSQNAIFSDLNIGQGINVIGSDGTIIRMTIHSYISSTVVTARPNKTIEAGMIGVQLNNWEIGISIVNGLWNLEGQNVSVFADGYVVASPNNDAYEILTVTNGQITLPRNFGVIQVGVPITSDIETLDIDMSNAPTISTVNKHINQVAVRLYESRGFFSGPISPEEDFYNITVPPTPINPLTNLYESKMRDHETENEPIHLTNDVVKLNISSTFNNNGRVFIRNVDPIPLSVLSIVPSGDIPSMR